MKLIELAIGNRAVITAVNSSDELKKRLASFGLLKGSIVEIEVYSPAKKTVEIIVDDTHIGLRSSEAELIEVERI